MHVSGAGRAVTCLQGISAGLRAVQAVRRVEPTCAALKQEVLVSQSHSRVRA